MLTGSCRPSADSDRTRDVPSWTRLGIERRDTITEPYRVNLIHQNSDMMVCATERANRDIAIGCGKLFGSDSGGRTAAVLMSFIASCKRCRVEPFASFRDVLSRIATHPVNRLAELLPHNWKPLAAAQA